MFAQDIVQHIAHYRCIWTEHQLEARNVLRNKIWYGQLRYDEKAEETKGLETWEWLSALTTLSVGQAR